MRDSFAAPSPVTVVAGHSRAAEPSPPSPGSPASLTRTRSRGSSITESLMNARPPLGALAATGEAFGRAPSLSDLRRSSVSSIERRRSLVGGRRGSSMSAAAGGLHPTGDKSACIPERRSEDHREPVRQQPAVVSSMVDAAENDEKLPQKNGARGSEDSEDEEEEKSGAWATTVNGLKAFWKFFMTPIGFFVTIYMLNVVAWGGMLFLLLCNAAPAMCVPTCDDINSPRRKWIEIDSQILNALFCVTGFGLVPWRFRDLYYLLSWRWFGKQSGYLKLQEINANWYRPEQPASSPENGAAAAIAEDPGTATGQRAPPTKSWKLDYVIWLYVWNTFFQCCLSGFMWGMDRYERPSWSTGLFVALACIVAGMAGGQVWWESRKVKRIEGDKKEVRDGSKEEEEKVRGVEDPDELSRQRRVSGACEG